MISAANMIRDMTHAHTSGQRGFPGALWSIFSAFHKVHRMWRWYRLKEVYANPDNFLKLTGGHLLNFVAGDKLVLKVAAQCVAISSRIMQCLEQKETLSLAFTKWKNAFKGTYPLLTRVKWIKNTKFALFSPSTKLWWQSKFKNLIERIKLIVIATFRLIKEAFILSMRIMDTLDLFSWNPATHSQCVNEIFVNISKNIEKLVSKKLELLEGLKQNQAIIDKMLNGIGNPFSSKQLISVVTKTLEKTEQAYKTSEKVSKTVGVVVTEYFRKCAFDVANIFMPIKDIPKFLVPKHEKLPWNRPSKEILIERFPPLQLFGKIDKTIHFQKLIAIPTQSLFKTGMMSQF